MYPSPLPAAKADGQSANPANHPHECNGDCHPDAYCACCLGECACGEEPCYQTPTTPALRVCNVPPGREKVEALSRREAFGQHLWHPMDLRHEDVQRAGRGGNRIRNGADVIGGAVLFHGVVTPPSPLSNREGVRLVMLEAEIMREHPYGLVAGAALSVIDAEQLYRGSYHRFPDYCMDRWGLLMSRVRELIGAAEGEA